MARTPFSTVHLIAFSAAGLGLLLAPSALASETTTYTYDVHGRLVEVNVADTSSGNNDGVKVVYEYDDAHNRTKKTVTGA